MAELMLGVNEEAARNGPLSSGDSQEALKKPLVRLDSPWLNPSQAVTQIRPLSDAISEGDHVPADFSGSDEENALTYSILIVDDEQLNLDMLSRRLRRSGFLVEVAGGGRQALDMIQLQAFDLILLDQMMPDVNGSEVLRLLRAEFSPLVLPVVMVTAVAESDKIAEAMEAGANDYITKPIDFKVALARIRSQLARMQAEKALRQSEERYALAAKATRDGVWDWNLVSNRVYYSPRWKEMLGEDGHQVNGSAEAWFSRILPADRETVKAAVQQHLDGQTEVLQCGYRMLHADGSMRWMSCCGIVTRDQRGKPVRLAGSQSDVTSEKTQDALTGMPNRLLLLSNLECLFERSGPSTGEAASHAVLFLDVDKFKEINDSLGHLAGDQLLREIAGRLLLIVRQYDENQSSPLHPLAARMGGDEFAILLRNGATGEAVKNFAEQAKQAMKAPFEIDGHTVHCTFSIGSALASPSHSKCEDLLRDADFAMYSARRDGRGQIAVYEPAMRDMAVQKVDLQSDIRLAVERDELQVFYQPKVDLATGLTYGIEALLRWNHPKYGQIQPGIFIPIAEETGAIVEMGKWILSEACSQVRAWQQAFPMDSPLELSVNLSPREFIQKDLVAQVGLTLQATAFPASALHLEVTEGVLFEDIEAARTTLVALKELGVRLDLDDFGSGYSSLRYLQELPFDLLKIDRYFIMSLDTEQPSSGDLIQTILSMAENLGMEVVAEGIETSHHSQRLKELGCRLGQGYYFSRPIEAGAMQAFLTLEHILPSVSRTPRLSLPHTATVPELPCS